jgi:hypothetical protein
MANALVERLLALARIGVSVRAPRALQPFELQQLFPGEVSGHPAMSHQNHCDGAHALTS